MCQPVKNASPPEGACKLSPSVSERLGFPDCGSSVANVCDAGPTGLSASCEKSFCSFENSSYPKSRTFLACESSGQNKSMSQTYTMSSTGSACLKDLRVCSCLRKASSPQYSRKCKVSYKFGFNLLTVLIRCKPLVFLLVILLRTVLTEGFPPPLHKIRHHHMKPEELPPCSQRARRDIRTMSLKESENAGLCPSWACLDTDERRRPVHITRVICQSTNNSTCSKLGGDYQCTQLYAQMEVWQEESKPREDNEFRVELWTSDNKTRALVSSKISVEHGCLCASMKAKPAANLLNILNNTVA